MNVEIGTEAAQFPEKEYINGIAVAVSFSSVHHNTLVRRKLLLDSLAITRNTHNRDREKSSGRATLLFNI
jgi:hypothetical protein